jgi:hypothetical protein
VKETPVTLTDDESAALLKIYEIHFPHGQLEPCEALKKALAKLRARAVRDKAHGWYLGQTDRQRRHG